MYQRRISINKTRISQGRDTVGHKLGNFLGFWTGMGGRENRYSDPPGGQVVTTSHHWLVTSEGGGGYFEKSKASGRGEETVCSPSSCIRQNNLQNLLPPSRVSPPILLTVSE